MFTNTPTVLFLTQGPIGLYHCPRSGHGHRKEDGAHTTGEAETSILNGFISYNITRYTLRVILEYIMLMGYTIRSREHPNTPYCIY